MTVKTRARQPKNKPINAAASLMAALEFVMVAQNKKGMLFQKHVLLNNGTITATDGTVSIGTFIEERITCCPQSDLFLAALSKCGEQFAMTIFDEEKLCIQSGEFTAYIPCAPIETMPNIEPLSKCGQIDNNLVKGINAVINLSSDAASSVMASSLLINPNTIMATNMAVIMEYWHGLDFPKNVIVPKYIARHIAKCGKELSSLGYDGVHATFWFNDDSFIKIKLIVEGWADVQSVLNYPDLLPLPVLPDFWKGVDTISALSEDGVLYLSESGFHSKPIGEQGATYDFDGLPNNLNVEIKSLKLVKPYMETADLSTHPNRIFFFGENCRGVIAGVTSE